MIFSKTKFRGVTFQNRVVMSPMCQYSAEDGLANDWHLIHLGSRAVGGVGAAFVEATAVEPEGRITYKCMGLWDDKHIEPLARIARFLKSQGTVPGIQLAHAGRKASTDIPWKGGKPLVNPDDRPWKTVAPSAIPFSSEHPAPLALNEEGIRQIQTRFVEATERAIRAGFQIIEFHAAHGYLAHSFLSPLSNHRTDKYGGSLENRMRFCLETVEKMRAVMPPELPFFVRISASDWIEGGWTIDDSIVLARELKKREVDLVDCSSGGAAPGAKIPLVPHYQVPLAERVKKEADIATGAVGLITEPVKANEILEQGQADLVFLARALLREPYWVRRAQEELSLPVTYPPQYERAARRR